MRPLVVDASALIAALVDYGPVGDWAEHELAGAQLCAPALIFVEVASGLRKRLSAGAISDQVAASAHDELLDMTIELYQYEPFGHRVWELRQNVRPYDAWYVAVAEELVRPLMTLDSRLARASGPRCQFVLPP